MPHCIFKYRISIGRNYDESKGEQLVQVTATITPAHLVMTIEDNGIGRKTAMELQRLAGYTSTSSLITEERLRLMKSEEAVLITIIDKVENGEASGTIVVLSIPHGADR